MRKYMYLKDRRGYAVLGDPDTGRVVFPMYDKIVGHSGLRRQILVQEKPGASLVETTEFVPITPEIAGRLALHHEDPNSWNFDWPQYPVESRGDDPRIRAIMEARLYQIMAPYALNVRIVGLQRRYLMYFSDGNYKSQGRFLRVAPHPGQYPYDVNGHLLDAYTSGATLDELRAGTRKPEGGTAPLLYAGPAWVVRVTIDGQQPAFGGCRVYVRDDGSFICSDWCQRDPTRADTTIHSQYSKGIDLLSGQSYTLGSWLAGPCIGRAIQQGEFRPKEKIHTVQVGRIKLPPPVPSMAQALANYQPAIQAMVTEGRNYDQIMTTLTERLQARTTKGLHLVPVRLRLDMAFADEVRQAYGNTYVDAMQQNNKYPDYFVLANYVVPAGSPTPENVTEESYCTVNPLYLEIDADRVRELVRAHSTGDDTAVVERALASAFAALDRRDRPMPVVPWEPGPERFGEAVPAAVAVA